MRTTVEISDEHRARLMALAAQRGEKGFSRLVDEAVALLLADQDRREEARRLAIVTRGALAPDEADELAKRARATRERWR